MNHVLKPKYVSGASTQQNLFCVFLSRRSLAKVLSLRKRLSRNGFITWPITYIHTFTVLLLKLIFSQMVK